MADGLTTPDYSKYLQEQATPASNNDPFNYQQIRQTTSNVANSTRQVGGTGGYNAGYDLYKSIPSNDYINKGQAKGALAKASGDIKGLKSQAEKAATGVEMMGAGVESYMRRLQQSQDFATGAFNYAAQSWDAAAEKADEYVQASRDRVGQVLSQLDSIHEQMGKDRDFSRAHSMQAGVQASIGSMKGEERNILNQYGVNSKEYEQFYQSKQVALATMQSNIFTSYQQFTEQADIAYLNATNEAMWKQNMYTSFQEQQHVEMLKFTENAKFGYAMQKANFDVAVEQLRMNGMENFANWIVGTPNFSYDSMPLVTVLSDLIQDGINARAVPDTSGNYSTLYSGLGHINIGQGSLGRPPKTTASRA